MGGSSLLGDDSRSVMADDDSQESVRKPPISYGKLELINNKEVFLCWFGEIILIIGCFSVYYLKKRKSSVPELLFLSLRAP